MIDGNSESTPHASLEETSASSELKLAIEEMQTKIANVLDPNNTSISPVNVITGTTPTIHLAFRYRRFPEAVAVTDSNNTQYKFEAITFPSTNQRLAKELALSQEQIPHLSGISDDSKALHLNIKTADKGNRAVFLKAGVLFNQAWDYLIKQGNKIDIIIGDWLGNNDSLSTNYDQFQTAVKEIQTIQPKATTDTERKSLEKDALEKAAFKTWTGAKAREKGFTEAKVIHLPDQKRVVALFLKPQLPKIS